MRVARPSSSTPTAGHRQRICLFVAFEDKKPSLANVIITPDVFAAHKRTIVDEPYLVIDGALQNQDGAVSVKADRIEPLRTAGPEADSHDFH